MGLTVFDRFQTALAAFEVFNREFAEWSASSSAPRLRTLIDHRDPGDQHLDVIVGSPPEQLDRLSTRVVDVVHPVRVAYDTVERRKRQIGLDEHEWPPADSPWQVIRDVDNLGKHDAGVDLVLWMSDAFVIVSDKPGGKELGRLNADPTPRPIPAGIADSEGVSITRVASIPERWRGPAFFYGVGAVFELRFGEARGASGLVVDDVLATTLKSGAALLSILKV